MLQNKLESTGPFSPGVEVWMRKALGSFISEKEKKERGKEAGKHLHYYSRKQEKLCNTAYNELLYIT